MAARAFETNWPEIEERLRARLTARGLPPFRCDDLVQETGLRLFKMWDKVDHDRPLWPLAVTILLNLQRDEARRNPARELLGGVPDAPTRHDVEAEGLARIEFGRVCAAMNELSPDHRSVLLMELGHTESNVARGAAALKMLRLRARRKLTSVLEGAAAGAGVIGVRIRSGSDAALGFIGNKLGNRSFEQIAPAGAAVLTALMLSALPGVPGALGAGVTQDDIRTVESAMNRMAATHQSGASSKAGEAVRSSTTPAAVALAAKAPKGSGNGSGGSDDGSAHVELPTGTSFDVEGEITVLGSGIKLGEGGNPFCVQGPQPESRNLIMCQRPGSSSDTWTEVDAEVDTGTGRKIGVHAEAGTDTSL